MAEIRYESQERTPVGPVPLVAPVSLSAPVSPTGTPWLPPGAVKWAALAYAIIGPTLLALSQFFPQIPAFALALQIVSSIALVLGLASPGLRSVAKVLVLGLALTSLSACKTPGVIPPVVVELLECGADAVKPRVPAIAAAIVAVIQDPRHDWQPVLDQIIAAGGEAGACAWAVVYSQVTSGVGTRAVPAAGPVLLEAEIYQRAQLYQGTLSNRARAAR